MEKLLFEPDESRLMDNWDPKGFVWSDDNDDTEILPTELKNVRRIIPTRHEGGVNG